MGMKQPSNKTHYRYIAHTKIERFYWLDDHDMGMQNIQDSFLSHNKVMDKGDNMLCVTCVWALVTNCSIVVKILIYCFFARQFFYLSLPYIG